MKRVLCIFFLLIVLMTSQAFAGGIPTPAAGDTVTFGRYEQDNVIDNGPEPIEWIVLQVEDGKAWLLSKNCIEMVIFYPERVPMYWAKTELRSWMNGEFIDKAFSAEEQEIILTTAVHNTNPHGMRGAGEDTLDKVYLLSYDEVMSFFPEMADRVAYPSEYVKAKGCTLSEETGSCRWWTRTSGARNLDMCGIRLDGRMTKYGMQDVDWPGNTMRPCMWVQCDDAR